MNPMNPMSVSILKNHVFNCCDGCRQAAVGCVKMLKCGNCLQRQYCNRECQKRNWKSHREDCKRLCQLDPVIAKQQTHTYSVIRNLLAKYPRGLKYKISRFVFHFIR